MKMTLKMLTLFCLAGCAAGTPALAAKVDGTYLHEVGRSYVTPHLEWGGNFAGKPLRVLFITERLNAREAAENAQRMKMEFRNFTMLNWANLAGTDVYEGTMTGTSPAEKEQELRKKLEEDYDVIVFYRAWFEKLPDDLQFIILDKLRNGTGLVYDCLMPIRYRKVIADRRKNPFAGRFPATLQPNELSAYQFGKGRLLQFKVKPLPEGALRNAAYENRQAFLLQSMIWAAGRDNGCAIASIAKENGGIKVKLAGDDRGAAVKIRIRDGFNHVAAEREARKDGVYTAEIPDLPAGDYYADVFVMKNGETLDFGIGAFKISSRHGGAALRVQNAFIGKNESIRGSLSLGKAPADGAELRLLLADHPYGRVWAEKKIPWTRGARLQEFTWSDRFIPTIAGTLYAELKDAAGKVSERRHCELFFPNRDIPPYFAYGWGLNRSVSGSMQLSETFGLNACLTQFSSGTAREAAFLNQRLIPYMLSIALVRDNKTGGLRFFHNYFLPPELKKKAKEVDGDACFYRPEVREIWRGAIRHRIKNTPPYGIPVYSLGDENNYNVNAGFGPSDAIYFREFLKEKYRTVDALNREWKSAFADFSAVPHPTLEEARKAGNWAAWNDHQEYMEKMYADLHHFCAEEIRRIDPGAKVGSEGSMPGDIELTIRDMEYWGPYRNLLDSEAMRCFGGKRLRTVWYGYHNERGAGKYPLLLQDLLSGVINGMGWYEVDEYSTMCILGVDNTPSYPAGFIAELNRMRFGTGELLVKTPLLSSGLALFWSHPSKRAAELDKRMISPVDSLSPLVRFLYRRGINFDMVSERTMERLENGSIRTLFLAGTSVLGDKTAQALIRFVRNGGTLIADMNCALLNSCFSVNRKNPLAELFGDLTLATLKTPEVRRVSVTRKWNGKMLNFRAEKALSNPGAEFCTVRTCGKGRAVLLNFTLPMAEVTAEDATPFDAFLLALLKGAGVSAEYDVSLPDSNGMARIRTGKGFRLIGAHVANRFVAPGSKGRIRLPSPKHIYRCGKAYLGRSAEIVPDFSASPLELFAAFDEKQPPLRFHAPDSAKPGAAVLFDFSSMPGNRIIHLAVSAPDGKAMRNRGMVLDTAEGPKCVFRFALSDPAGKYEFLVTDILTGSMRKHTINLEP